MAHEARCPRCGYTEVLTMHEVTVGRCEWYGDRPHQTYRERDIHLCANRRYCGHRWSPQALYIEGGA